MSKRKAIPAFMAYVEDLTGQSREESKKDSKSIRKYNNVNNFFFPGLSFLSLYLDFSVELANGMEFLPCVLVL